MYVESVTVGMQLAGVSSILSTSWLFDVVDFLSFFLGFLNCSFVESFMGVSCMYEREVRERL